MRKQDKNLAHFFKNVIMMSGTPDWVQQEMTLKNKCNECRCSPKLAMDNGWICKPSLNLVNCDEHDWPAAVKAVFDREMRIYEDSNKVFRPTILVNCKSIDDVVQLRNISWFRENAGKKFHLISIHSSKVLHDSTGNVMDVSAEIDGKQVEAEDAYREIVKIDNLEDDLPVIVFQVQMIGEGINVRSFNAVITASNCDKTAMQQIGRAIRNFSVTKAVAQKVERPSTSLLGKLFKRKEVVEDIVAKTFTKVDDGHANVYVIDDNLKTMTNLIVKLSNYDLTSSCFTWGDKIDISTGSSLDILDAADSCKLKDAGWHAIEGNDPQIVEVISSSKKKILTACFDKFLDGSEDNDGNGIPDIVEFRDLLAEKHRDGWLEVWTGRKTLADAQDVMQRFRDKVAKMLDDSTCRDLWRKDRKTALLYAVQDPVMAEFLDTHLSDKTFESFVM